MSAGFNLSRRDAWTRVSQYVGLWLLFWLLLGLAGIFGSSVTPIAVVDDVPRAPVLIDNPLVLRGPVLRTESRAVNTGEYASDQQRRPSVPGGAAASTGVSEATRAGTPTTTGAAGFFAGAPPGFADLAGVQKTQADIYFQDQMLLSSFIEFDLEHVWLLAPEEVIAAIPTLKNPEEVLAAISGQLDSNSHLLCNSRVRDNCGNLEPEVAGIIFDEGKFRVNLFVHHTQLTVQMLVGDRYLPAPSASWATLHDMSLTASGQQGNNRYSVSGESFLSKGSGRARVRYGLTNSEPALHEASWQWDNRDREFEAGVFRGARGTSLFVNDKRLLGVRVGSSTKTRTDLDNALATPVLIFLDQRSRVDVLRDNEVLDSRFYNAGNHQLDTTRLPDGAYDITVRTVSADGLEQSQQHFFVRNSLLPPLGENQFYVEGGAFTEEYGSNLPRTVGGGWLRGGMSHRFSETFALEGEALFSSETNLFQGGAYFLGRGWQVHTGAMASDRGDRGVSLRGQFQRKRLSLHLSAAHLDSKAAEDEIDRFDDSLTSNIDFAGSGDLDVTDDSTFDRRFLAEQRVVGGSYTQASASLSFPLEIPLWNGKKSKGQAHIRAQYNQRNGGQALKGIGFNYFAPLFRRNAIAADWSLESLYSNNRSLVRMGIDLRWRNGRQGSLIRPQIIASQTRDQFTNERGAVDIDPSLNASWNRSRRSDRLGDVNEGLYVVHQGDRSVFGGRLASQSNYGFSEMDLSYVEGAQSGLQYVANSRFNLVSKDGKSTLGGGSSQLAAIVVEIDGDLPDADFKIVVDGRVAGYASTTKRGVVSLRPYDTYDVRISPAGDDILGYDEQSYDVTLFPGNVHRLVFSAHELRIIVSQAVTDEGAPIAYGKFINVDGYGATDVDGWFQVEVSHSENLQVRLADGSFCAIAPPPSTPEEDGLAVLDALVCRAIPVPPSE